jgi:hypothetical protein
VLKGEIKALAAKILKKLFTLKIGKAVEFARTKFVHLYA